MEKTDLRQASGSRQQLLVISSAIEKIAHRLIAPRVLIKGTIYNHKRRCGNKNCKCARGELHGTNLLSFSDQGRTRLIPLTKYSTLELSKIRSHVGNYQRFRTARAEIVRYFKMMISEINRLERGLLVEVPPKKGEGNAREKSVARGKEGGR